MHLAEVLNASANASVSVSVIFWRIFFFCSVTRLLRWHPHPRGLHATPVAIVSSFFVPILKLRSHWSEKRWLTLGSTWCQCISVAMQPHLQLQHPAAIITLRLTLTHLLLRQRQKENEFHRLHIPHAPRFSLPLPNAVKGQVWSLRSSLNFSGFFLVNVWSVMQLRAPFLPLFARSATWMMDATRSPFQLVQKRVYGHIVRAWLSEGIPRHKTLSVSTACLVQQRIFISLIELWLLSLVAPCTNITSSHSVLLCWVCMHFQSTQH
jgi:hypothetical protein